MKRFDAAWRVRCHIEACSISDVTDMLARHYLQRKPGTAVAVYRMICDGLPVGCIVYSLPPRETQKRYGGVTWELSRLWISDEIPSNAETWLISKSLRAIRTTRREVEAVVSYADSAQGHQGTIYRAANFTPDGMTDDDRKTPRFDLVSTLTGKKYGRASHVPSGEPVERIRRSPKHRYIYRMAR